MSNKTTQFDAHSKNDKSEICLAMNLVLADIYALYFKTKSYHWHVSGPSFRDYHLLFDEQSSEILASADTLAERVRKLGGVTLLSINHAAKITRIVANTSSAINANDMMDDLLADNLSHAANLKSLHAVCAQYADVASTSVLETFIDESEKRAWFLREIVDQIRQSTQVQQSLPISQTA